MVPGARTPPPCRARSGPPRSVHGEELSSVNGSWPDIRRGCLPGPSPSGPGLLRADPVRCAEGGKREIGLQGVVGGLRLLVDVVNSGVALAGERPGNPGVRGGET